MRRQIREVPLQTEKQARRPLTCSCASKQKQVAAQSHKGKTEQRQRVLSAASHPWRRLW